LADLRERLTHIISNDWLSVSAKEWIASENNTQDQDNKNQMNLIIVTIQLPIRANKTE